MAFKITRAMSLSLIVVCCLLAIGILQSVSTDTAETNRLILSEQSWKCRYLVLSVAALLQMDRVFSDAASDAKLKQEVEAMAQAIDRLQALRQQFLGLPQDPKLDHIQTVILSRVDAINKARAAKQESQVKHELEFISIDQVDIYRQLESVLAATKEPGTIAAQKLRLSAQPISIALALVAGLCGCALIRFLFLDQVRLRRVEDNLNRLLEGKSLPEPPAGNDSIAEIDRKIYQIGYQWFLLNRDESAPLSIASDLIGTLDANGVIVRLNRVGCQILGAGADDLIKQPIANFIQTADGKRLIELAGTRRSFEFESIHTRDGREVFMDWACIWSTVDEVYFCVARDMTALHVAQKFKNDLLRMVSHDLKSPLTSAGLVLSNIADGLYGNVSAQGVTKITNTHADLERVIRMVNDLLDMERLDSGQLELIISEHTVGELVKTAWRSVEPLAETKNIKMELSTEEIWMAVDWDRMLEVLINLFSNAIKYSAAGTHVNVGGSVEDGWAAIDITDHGVGMAPQDLKRAGEPYFRVDDASSEGTGYGLYICKQMVLLHGGKMNIESRPGGGTTVKLLLPLAIN